MKSKSIGSVEDLLFHEQGLSFKTGSFHASISFYAEDIIRVRLRPINCEERKKSYAVVMPPTSNKVEIKEGKDQVTLKSSKAEISFTKKPFRITLKDAKGNVLSEDDPAFGTSLTGTEVCTYRKLQEGERFIGLGEKVGPLDKRGRSYENWNTDKFAYSIEEDPLYLSNPFFIGVHDQGVYGLFLDNTHRSRFNFGASSHRYSWFSAQDGEMDYYLFTGKDIASIIASFTRLTGPMQLPPMWSLGYQQCRYSYYPDHEIKSLARTFREKKIPADALYLDIHYMKDYKAFTFDQDRFPDPVGMHKELKEQGFRTVAIVDPGIKVQKGYGTYDRGVTEDVFIKMPDGERYQCEVWPSWSHFPDFTSEKVRDWWKKELQFYKDAGVSGIWNDMNEPAAWGQSLPEHLEFEMEGQTTTHREARNVYGMQMARATQEGLKSHHKSERPFVLTRAGFSGVQRYSAVWTGDNVSSDEHMLLACRMQMGLGLSGISFSANDIGGFAGEASPALFARWIALGAFQPMFRGHTQVNHRDAEPWSFGEEVEQIARNYISLRYRLLPYIYTCLHRSSQDGMPMMRSLAMIEPRQAEVYDPRFENQFLCGDHLMIIPCTSQVQWIEAYFPKGNWYDIYTDQKYKGGMTHVLPCPMYRQPVLVKEGAVIPMQSQIQSTAEKHDGTLYLHIYLGAQQSSVLYEDDGISYRYEKGAMKLTSWNLKKDALSISSEGDFKSLFKKIKLIFHGTSAPKEIKSGNKKMKTKEEENRFIHTISGIDTFYADKGAELSSQVRTVTIDMPSNTAELIWKN